MLQETIVVEVRISRCSLSAALKVSLQNASGNNYIHCATICFLFTEIALAHLPHDAIGI